MLEGHYSFLTCSGSTVMSHQAQLCPRCLRQTVRWDNLILSSSIHQFTFLPYLTKQRAQGISLSSILKIQRLIQKANVFTGTWIKTISDFSFISTKVYHKKQGVISLWEMAHPAFLSHWILVAAYNHVTAILRINIGSWKQNQRNGDISRKRNLQFE